MSLMQLSAAILAGAFSVTTIGSELMLSTDKTRDEKRFEAKFDTGKDKSRKESPWETRQMMPSGPKF